MLPASLPTRKIGKPTQFDALHRLAIRRANANERVKKADEFRSFSR